jgi:nitronate monooxygenase
LKLKPLHIGELIVQIPIIQGGMGIGVSASRLAAAVANAGGIGIISGVQTGYREPDFRTNNLLANVRGIKKEIAKARELAPGGIIGVNILTAINHYREIASAAVEAGIDMIISGAGLPTELPDIVKGSKTKVIPIVSSGRAAAVLSKMWDKKYQFAADAVIVEGPLAGGHLGFSRETLLSDDLPPLTALVQEVKEALQPYAERYNKKIPIIAAGGIFDGKDIAEQLLNGADGVQMATRFVATEECDAHENFKQAFLDSTESTISIIQSPIGMPGRAIRNPFIIREESGEKDPLTHCYKCIKMCHPGETPYCISNALIDSVTGDTENGLVFAGSNAYRLHKLTTVKQLMDELVAEAEEALEQSS